MDAYIFVRRASRAVMKALVQLHDEMPERVRAVAATTGPFDAIVFVDVEGFNELEELVRDKIRREAGAIGTETAVALYGPDEHGAMTAVWTPPLPWPHRSSLIASKEVLARVRTQAGMAENVLRGLFELEGFLGAAIVAGPFDILLEIGAETFEELSSRLLAVNGVNGILWTDSAFASIVAY